MYRCWTKPFTEQRRELESQHALKTQTLASLQKQRSATTDECAKLALDDQIIAHADEIDDYSKTLAPSRKQKRSCRIASNPSRNRPGNDRYAAPTFRRDQRR